MKYRLLLLAAIVDGLATAKAQPGVSELIA
jgi:hypothetical protein